MKKVFLQPSDCKCEGAVENKQYVEGKFYKNAKISRYLLFLKHI